MSPHTLRVGAGASDPSETLRVALLGAQYFAASASLDLENGDHADLLEHLRRLREIVIRALQAHKQLPALAWPDTTTREKFAVAAAEWRADQGRAAA